MSRKEIKRINIKSEKIDINELTRYFTKEENQKTNLLKKLQILHKKDNYDTDVFKHEMNMFNAMEFYSKLIKHVSGDKETKKISYSDIVVKFAHLDTMQQQAIVESYQKFQEGLNEFTYKGNFTDNTLSCVYSFDINDKSGPVNITDPITLFDNTIKNMTEGEYKSMLDIISENKKKKEESKKDERVKDVSESDDEEPPVSTTTTTLAPAPLVSTTTTTLAPVPLVSTTTTTLAPAPATPLFQQNTSEPEFNGGIREKITYNHNNNLFDEYKKATQQIVKIREPLNYRNNNNLFELYQNTIKKI
jgi:hypothetical protein